jgi:hypothetical protein
LALAERRYFRAWRGDPKRKPLELLTFPKSRAGLTKFRGVFHAEGTVPKVVAFNEYRDPEGDPQMTRMARNMAKRMRKERRRPSPAKVYVTSFGQVL